MTVRKGQSKREREAKAEPTTEQANTQQSPAEIARARVWELHLRGLPKVRIAAEVKMDRGTVAKIINESYKEVAAERKLSNARKLNEAVARWRRLQEQAWADHDTDDERERQVLALGQQQQQPAADGKDGKPSNVSIRFQSQRSQYLRIILDAEKEIARLEGLYEGILDVDAAVAVAFYRIGEKKEKEKGSENSHGAVARLSGANRGSLPAPLPSVDGEA